MKRDDRQLLIEAATSAFRARDPGGRIMPSPAWMDLAPEDREAAFERQIAARRVEQVLDSSGLSTTARSVLARIRNLGQLEREE
jgi:hypothetical protein